MYPDRHQIYQKFSIQKRQQLAPHVSSLTFQENLEDAQPGQYCMTWLPRFDEKPFMIAGNQPLELLVEHRGPFTNLITDATQSINHLHVRGPLGRGFRIPESTTERIAAVIDNIAGIAAIQFLNTELQRVTRDIRILIDNSLYHQFQDPPFQGSLHQTYQNHQQFQILDHLCQTTDHLLLSPATPEIISEVRSHPNNCLRSAQGVFTDVYIACSMGICGSCEIEGGQLVCTEGPVINIL